MFRTRLFLASTVILLATLPAFAQRGGPPRGGSNFNHNHSNYHRGGTSFGITLGSPRTGLSFSYGQSPYGNFYGLGVGGSGYRPYYYGGGFGYGGFGSTIYPAPFITPRTYVLPQTYYVPPTTYVVPVQPSVTTVTPAAPTPVETTTTATEQGLLITELKPQGSAKAAGLRQGDVILAVDGKRIQNYEELRAVLTTAGKTSASVEYIDGSNNQIDKKNVAIVDGKLGITIEEVPLQRQ